MLLQHADKIGLRAFEYLISLQDSSCLYNLAAEYATDAGKDLDSYVDICKLIDEIGQKIDRLKFDLMVLDEKTDQIRYRRLNNLYIDYEMTHYGLLAILFGRLNPKEFSKA